jgi:hypothetical protein
MAGDIKRRVTMLKHWVQVADVLIPKMWYLMVAMFGCEQLFWINVDYIRVKFNSDTSTKEDLGNGSEQNNADF